MSNAAQELHSMSIGWLTAGNAYSVFPKSTIRDASIGLLVAHTCVAFLLFIIPLYVMCGPFCLLIST